MADEPKLLALPMTAAYFRLILRRFGSSPERLAALLEGTGVGHDFTRAAGVVDDDLPVRAQMRQLANLHALAESDWGLELGGALDGATHGPAGAVAVTAATIGAALEVLARYATVRTPFIDLRGRRGRGRFELRVLEPCRLGAVRTQVLEMVLLSTQGVVESALGRRMEEATFVMPAPRPPHWRRYEEFFHAPTVFSGDAAAVSLPLAWLELPCPLADAVAHRAACARLEAIRQRLAGDYVDARVESLLEAGDDTGFSLAEMAVRLRLSPRTLVRRLAQRQTTYRRLLDDHRRRRAVDLLAQPELTVAEVAARLGYEDATNFGRACRRWFGMSPGAYRAAGGAASGVPA